MNTSTLRAARHELRKDHRVSAAAVAASAHQYESLAQMAHSGKLLLRVLIGALMLFHGIAKLQAGVDPIMGMLAKQGLPGELAYLAYVGEIVAPALMIIGLWTRPAALLVAANMIVAVWLAHMPDLLLINEHGGWALELQAMYLFGALAVALLGAGRYSAGGSLGRFN